MDSVGYLLSPEGLKLLDSLPPYDAAEAPVLSANLRRQGYSADTVSAALTQQRLRAKAALKFGHRAATMLFTDNGYQQATRALVARVHAQRYVDAGCTNILDMTSGIGADSLAFAQAGLSVTAVDIDPITSACAAHNLRGFPWAQAVLGDAFEIDLGKFDGVFADPARRSARGRTFNPKDYTPSLGQILQVRDSVPALGVKVAPGIGYADLPEDCHAQWVSIEGDVVEAGLWFGPLANGPGRSALVFRGDVATQITATENPRDTDINLAPRALGEFIYEPDGAVIRSGAIPVLARRLDAAPVSESIAYLTGNYLERTPLAVAFRVIDSMQIKRVASYLKDHQVGSVEILKRGTDIVPDQFRKSLKLKGPRSATVILTRLMGKHAAVIVERVAEP